MTGLLDRLLKRTAPVRPPTPEIEPDEPSKIIDLPPSRSRSLPVVVRRVRPGPTSVRWMCPGCGGSVERHEATYMVLLYRDDPTEVQRCRACAFPREAAKVRAAVRRRGR